MSSSVVLFVSFGGVIVALYTQCRPFHTFFDDTTTDSMSIHHSK
jgi:hypothetical protein